MKRNLFFIFASLYFLSIHIQAQEQRILRDKYAYETAIEMYSVADTATFNEEAALLIEKINNELKRGTLIEDNKIWIMLQQLEPYRMSAQIDTAVLKWVDDMKVPPSPVASLKYDLDSLTKAYLDNDFDGLISMSRQILTSILPINQTFIHAVRSNMALALMHQNKDLCARVELEAVKRIGEIQKDPYFPALINLTVLYERLRKHEAAETLSKELLDFAKKEELSIPLVNFNVAWFLDLNNDKFEKTDSILKIGKGFNLSKVGKHQSFINQVKKRYHSQSVFKIGWMGKIGLYGSGFKVFVAYVLCIIACIILLWMYNSLMKGLSGCVAKYASIILLGGFVLFVFMFLGAHHTWILILCSFWILIILSFIKR